jgi:hypothetical protein
MMQDRCGRLERRLPTAVDSFAALSTAAEPALAALRQRTA